MIPTVEDDGSRENPLDGFLPVDGWVAYHGTSSVFADRLESEGLKADNGVWTPEDCRAVCDAFKKLHWLGLNNGGYLILGAWGPNRDVRVSGKRHIYLAESYSQAAVYGRAPGETSQTLLRSLEDLLSFQTDGELRAEHVDSLKRKLHEPEFSSAREDVLAAILLAENIEWLVLLNRVFKPLLEQLRQITSQHQRVVYAVLLDKSTLGGGAFSQPMGIEVTKNVPPSQIIAKAFPVAPRKSDREIGPDTPPGHIDAMFRRFAIWHSRIAEANA